MWSGSAPWFASGHMPQSSLYIPAIWVRRCIIGSQATSIALRSLELLAGGNCMPSGFKIFYCRVKLFVWDENMLTIEGANHENTNRIV